MATGVISKLSAKVGKFFTWSEFVCKCKGVYCKGEVHITAPLVRVLDFLREKSGKAVTVISGIRCVKYNALPSIGGVANSQHIYGAAADVTFAAFADGIEAYKFIVKLWLAGYVQEISHCYIIKDKKTGKYTKSIHIDTGAITGTRPSQPSNPFSTDGFMGLKAA